MVQFKNRRNKKLALKSQCTKTKLLLNEKPKLK